MGKKTAALASNVLCDMGLQKRKNVLDQHGDERWGFPESAR
jgi:hypothetical protein